VLDLIAICTPLACTQLLYMSIHCLAAMSVGRIPLPGHLPLNCNPDLSLDPDTSNPKALTVTGVEMWGGANVVRGKCPDTTCRRTSKPARSVIEISGRFSMGGEVAWHRVFV